MMHKVYLRSPLDLKRGGNKPHQTTSFYTVSLVARNTGVGH